MITMQQRRGAMGLKAIRAVQDQFPREQFDRQFDLAAGATRLVLAAAAKKATGGPDPAKYGIDAEALAKEFAAKFGLPIERAARVVQVLVSEISVEAYFQEAADYLKKQRGEGDAAEVGDGGGDAPLNSTTASRGLDSLSVVRTMRQVTGDPSWGSHLAASSSSSQSSTSTTPSTRKIVLAGVPGRNVTERMMALIRAREPSRRWGFDDLWECACRELMAARAQGAEIVE